MIIVKLYLTALLFMAGNAIASSQSVARDFQPSMEYDRERRAIDFGFFVRNLLLKSATASNAKANISRNVINLKTTPAPRRRTTATTTAVPFIFNKGPFKFPFDLSAPINNKFNGGFLNFDYDYGVQQPIRPGRRRRPTTTTSTTTTTTTTAAPPPPPPPPQPLRRRPIPRGPYGFFGKQKRPPFDYYDDYDYDYNYGDVDNAPASTAAPAPAPAPPPAPAPSPASAPNPLPASPVKRPIPNRIRAQGRVPQLRNRLVYQFRQPGDTSTNNDGAPPADATNAQPPNNNSNNSNNDETSANANDDVNDDVDVVDDDDAAANDAGDGSNNPSDVNNSNTEQDYNDSSDSANPNVNQNSSNDNGNVPPPPPVPLPRSNFDFNAGVPAFQGRFGFGGNPSPSGFGNFVSSAGFPYSPYNNFNPQYQPSSPAGYSVRYY